MGRLIGAEESNPATPSSGSSLWYPDTSSNGVWYWKDDSGRFYGISYNSSIASQGAGFSSDTYVTNSDIQIPSFTVQAKTQVLWMISGSKTGAGTAAPVYTIRTGTNRTTADTSRLALTGPLQTAVADIGTLNVMITVRSVGSGSAAVIAGTAWWDHRGTAVSSTGGTGFANDGTGHVEGTSAGFDSTGLAGHYFGLSINGGASASWTITQAQVVMRI